jgi:hypothetical protein
MYASFSKQIFCWSAISINDTACSFIDSYDKSKTKLVRSRMKRVFLPIRNITHSK